MAQVQWGNIHRLRSRLRPKEGLISTIATIIHQMKGQFRAQTKSPRGKEDKAKVTETQSHPALNLIELSMVN